MKKYITLLFCLIGIHTVWAQNGYEIHVKIKGAEDTSIFLGHHYGDKQYVIDTVKTNSSGEAVFSGKDALPGGMYLVVVPQLKNKYFEFVMSGSEPKFTLQTDTADFIRNMKITGSNENKIFYEDLDFVTDKRAEADVLKDKLKTGDSSQIKEIKAQLKQINEDVESERDKLINKYPDLFYTKFIKALQEVEIPEAPMNPDGTKDSTFAYLYMRAHFFDYVDFSDERFLRTSLYSSKIDKYIKNYIVRVPDSIIIAVDYIINKASVDKETFKFVVVSLLNEYATSNIMGMDAVYVHIVDTYYKTGKAFWLDDVALYKIESQADRIRPTLIGKIAPDIILQDTSNADIHLYSLTSKYTVIVFWSVDCGHCKREIPKLEAAYQDIKNEGAEVYAAYTDEEWDKWKKWLKEHNYPWINVGNMKMTSTFQAKYNVEQTPTIFIINSNHEIIAKKIGVEQILDILKFYNEKNTTDSQSSH